LFRDFQGLRAGLAEAPPKTLVVAAAHDVHTLESVYAAAKEVPMQYILVGRREMILKISSELGYSPPSAAIVDGDDDDDCARKAVSLIRDGRGDVLMKGIIKTGRLLSAALDKSAGIRGSGTMSHLSILEIRGYHKLIGITDGGMIPSPTLGQKADIVRNTVAFYERMGIHTPKIAALSASEAVSEKIPETKDAAALQEMCEKGELGGCILEGPLSIDIAISREAAAVKGHASKISGDTDVLLVPNITVGNVLGKGLLYWGGAKMAGCVLGAKIPVVLVSRIATAEEKLFSIMLCLKAG